MYIKSMVPVRLGMYCKGTNKLNKAQTRSSWMSKQMQNNSKTELSYETPG